MNKYLVCLQCMEYIEVGVDHEFRFHNERHLDEIEAFLFIAHTGPGHSIASVDEPLLKQIEAQAIMDISDGQVH